MGGERPRVGVGSDLAWGWVGGLGVGGLGLGGERPRVWVGSDLAWGLGVGGWGNCILMQLGRFFFHSLTGDYL